MSKRKTKKAQRTAEAQETLPELSDRQLAFVLEYMANGGNGTAAYRKVYGEHIRGAQESASRLLSNAMVKVVLEARRQALVEKYEITEERILERLASHAFTEMGDVMRDSTMGGSWRVKDLQTIAPRNRPAIKSYSRSDGDSYSERVDLHDPLPAIKELVKYLNLFPKQRGSKTDAGSGRDAARARFKDALERIREKLIGPEPGDGGGGSGSDPADPTEGSNGC